MHTVRAEILARIVRIEEEVQACLLRSSCLQFQPQIPDEVISGHAVAAQLGKGRATHRCPDQTEGSRAYAGSSLRGRLRLKA